MKIRDSVYQWMGPKDKKKLSCPVGLLGQGKCGRCTSFNFSKLILLSLTSEFYALTTVRRNPDSAI